MAGHCIAAGNQGDAVTSVVRWSAIDIANLIEGHAQPGDTFTANNVWDWLGGAAVLDHPNGTMGSAFRIVKQRGVATPTGDIMQSTHPTRKRGMVRVWKWVVR